MFDVKVCGITNRLDAVHALSCGADYLGFVIYPPSPRAVTVDRMADIVTDLPAGSRCVAVLVEPSAALLDEALAAGVHAVQLHGDCPASVCDHCPVPVWRALNVAGPGLEAAASSWPAARYVVDAHAPGLYGGTGTLADWQAAAALSRRKRVLLAGGLVPANVAAAVRDVRPGGVDVSSGVEAEPGRKDHDKVKRFIDAARQAAAQHGEQTSGNA